MSEFSKEVKAAAEAEFAEEEKRRKIDEYKERLRRRRAFWVKVFPWRIVIERRDRQTAFEKLSRAYQDLVDRGTNREEELHRMRNEVRRANDMAQELKYRLTGDSRDAARYSAFGGMAANSISDYAKLETLKHQEMLRKINPQGIGNPEW